MAGYWQTWLEMAGKGWNGQKLMDIAGNGWKWLELAGNGWKQQEWLEIAGNDWKWLKTGWKWLEMEGLVENCWKLFKMRMMMMQNQMGWPYTVLTVSCVSFLLPICFLEEK